MKTYTKLGLWITGSWLALGSATMWWKYDPSLGLNEWGDFFAGLMAPLALLWVVLGFYQQGRELQLNTEALEAQKEALHAQQQELASQVEATRSLAASHARHANASEEAVQLERAKLERDENKELRNFETKIEPAGRNTTGYRHEFRFKVKQAGAMCPKLVKPDDAPLELVSDNNNLKIGDQILVTFPQSKETEGWLPCIFSIVYEDRARRFYRTHCEIKPDCELSVLEHAGPKDEMPDSWNVSPPLNPTPVRGII